MSPLPASSTQVSAKLFASDSCERREWRARRTEEERADTLFVCERRRSRRIQSARCASPFARDEASAASVGRSRSGVRRRREQTRFSSASDDESADPSARCASPSQGTRHSCERRESRAARRRSEQTRFSSASDDDVGGSKARDARALSQGMRHQLRASADRAPACGGGASRHAFRLRATTTSADPIARSREQLQI